MRKHAFPGSVDSVLVHGEHVEEAETSSSVDGSDNLVRGERGMCSVPIVSEEIRVPIIFLKIAGIDGSQATIHAVHAELIRAKPNDVSESSMCFVDGPIPASSPFRPEYPGRRYRRSRMGVWDFTQGGKERWVEDKLVKDKSNDDRSGQQYDIDGHDRRLEY